jgi:hypothetical protein
MKILSLDVGIKNLAFCLFDKDDNSDNFKIKKWDVLNITDQEVVKCCFIEKGKKCEIDSKYKKHNNYYCLKHAKKQPFIVPSSDLKTKYINKQKLQKLYDIADKYKIPYEQPIKKQNLINAINNYIESKCLDPIESVNASKVDLINIGLNIKTKFNEIFDDEETIDHVIIENQISPIANRMKTIQGMIAQYFIMSNVLVDNIEFISACNKLKEYNEEKSKYSTRKKLSTDKTLELLNNNFEYTDWVDFFMKHKKKDDLADSFLQGIWFIKNKI